MPTKPADTQKPPTTPKRKQPGPPPVRRYDLFCTDGGARLRLQLNDEGISPRPDGLDFMRERRWSSRSWDDIDSITVNSSALPDSAPIASCRIKFYDGEELLVTNANANGLSDGTRNGEFNDFVRDLHKRLLASGAAEDITFRAGHSRARSSALLISLVAAAGIFVVLPVVLFFITGRADILLMTLVGALLVVAGATLLGANRLGSYRPDSPPKFFN